MKARGMAGVAGLGLAAGALVIALTWALDRVMEPPYSGYLAFIVVAVAATEYVRRTPAQRAARMFRVYHRAREHGADERAARAALLARAVRDPGLRERLGREVEACWSGGSEKDRVLAGVASLLAADRKRLDPERLSAAYDQVRDRFFIPGWEALPGEFVGELHRRLDDEERRQLDAIVAAHQVFRQKFFRSPSALAADPPASILDFARLLASLGNHVRRETPGDAERAYRLSLRLRPDENLAHAGLALLLDRTGRTREAAREATIALGVLDDYAQRAAERVPTAEDISPFRSPMSLRAALERLVVQE